MTDAKTQELEQRLKELEERLRSLEARSATAIREAARNVNPLQAAQEFIRYGR